MILPPLKRNSFRFQSYNETAVGFHPFRKKKQVSDRPAAWTALDRGVSEGERKSALFRERMKAARLPFFCRNDIIPLMARE